MVLDSCSCRKHTLPDFSPQCSQNSIYSRVSNRPDAVDRPVGTKRLKVGHSGHLELRQRPLLTPSGHHSISLARWVPP
jgi:hypothetical protein